MIIMRLKNLLSRFLLPITVLTTTLTGGAITGAYADTPVFHPDYIISDAQYYGLNMTVDEIQTFLNDKGRNCNGDQCLKNVRADTPNLPADEYCSGYTGKQGETAAEIIYNSSKSCGISPKVLLVSIEKESGMVSTTSPSASRYNALLGYGCPETGCNSTYAGLFNQVYYGAEGFQKWGKAPGYRYKAGQTTTVAYHPDSSCGGLQITIKNAPTAALYNYTPYVPNAAALASGSGTGDSCSSYGNRNFWSYFVKWFGDPTAGGDPVTGEATEEAVKVSQPAEIPIYLIPQSVDDLPAYQNVEFHQRDPEPHPTDACFEPDTVKLAIQIMFSDSMMSIKKPIVMFSF